MSKPSGLLYLATPYSKWELGIDDAFREACLLAAILVQRGLKIFSPIAHTHPIAKTGGLNPLDHNLWLPFDEAIAEVCDGLIVAHMKGWEESRGIAHEIYFFECRNRPIWDLDPLTIKFTGRG